MSASVKNQLRDLRITVAFGDANGRQAVDALKQPVCVTYSIDVGAPLQQDADTFDGTLAEQSPVEMIRIRAVLDKQRDACGVFMIDHPANAPLTVLIFWPVLEQQLQTAEILELARVIERLTVADLRAVFQQQRTELRISRIPASSVERGPSVVMIFPTRHRVGISATIEQFARYRKLPVRETLIEARKLSMAKINERRKAKRSARCIDEFRRLRQGRRDSVSIRERRSNVDVRRREFPATSVNGGEEIIVGFEQ